QMAPNPTTGQLIGEDLSFCARAGALSIPVYVHTGVAASHMKQVWLAEDNYWAERITDPAALLRGGSESMLFGKPVKVGVTWPEGLPDGMSEEELAKVADAWDAERGRLADGGAREPRQSEPAGSPA